MEDDEEELQTPDPLLERIERRHDSLQGRAKVKGQRYAVDQVLDIIAQYRDFRKACQQYPELKEDDLAACLIYASELVVQDELNRLEGREDTNRQRIQRP